MKKIGPENVSKTEQLPELSESGEVPKENGCDLFFKSVMENSVVGVSE